MKLVHTVSASVEEHRSAAAAVLKCAILTVSDTRTEENDRSGGLIKQLLREQSHEIVDYRIVPDDPHAIRERIEVWSSDSSVDVILSNGGTGIASRDTTYDVVVSMLEKKLDGFGELFRMLSYQEIGAAAMLSRAVAGSIARCVIVSMPGSPDAVRLAMEHLILPEIAHVVFELRK